MGPSTNSTKNNGKQKHETLEKMKIFHTIEMDQYPKPLGLGFMQNLQRKPAELLD